jgi:hypothetical protein
MLPLLLTWARHACSQKIDGLEFSELMHRQDTVILDNTSAVL